MPLQRPEERRGWGSARVPLESGLAVVDEQPRGCAGWSPRLRAVRMVHADVAFTSTEQSKPPRQTSQGIPKPMTRLQRVCACVRMCAHVCTRVPMCARVCTCVHACAHVCACAREHVCMRGHACVHACVRVHVCVHTCVTCTLAGVSQHRPWGVSRPVGTDPLVAHTHDLSLHPASLRGPPCEGQCRRLC